MKPNLFWLCIFVLAFIAGCNTEEPQTAITVRVIADGRQRVYQIFEPNTVEQFLREPEVAIELSPLDRMNPEPWTQLFDGIIITIVRVTENIECVEGEIPYRQENQPVEGLEPGEKVVVSAKFLLDSESRLQDFIRKLMTATKDEVT